MPITINGSGSIGGINVGGLPDGVITTDDLASNAVTTPKLGANEQSGLCKAWVNFNGTGTVAIRASYNVSSITDHGVGAYTINFTTAMPDVNYALTGTAGQNGTGLGALAIEAGTTAPTTTTVRIFTRNFANNPDDFIYNGVAIFR